MISSEPPRFPCPWVRLLESAGGGEGPSKTRFGDVKYRRKARTMSFPCVGRTLAFTFLFTCLFVAVGLASIGTHRVLLVVNDASPTSLAIGRYYQSARGLPDINVCHLTTCPTDEQVGPEVWYDRIKVPIWNYLTDSSHPWLKDQIQVILLTKGVPLWFWADEWRDASVDMPLCYLGNPSPTGAEMFGWIGEPNCFYGQDQSFEVFRPSSSNVMTSAFPNLLNVRAVDSGVVLAGAATGLIFRKNGGVWSGVGDRNGAFSATDIVSLTSLGRSVWAAQATYSRWATYAHGGRLLKSDDQGATWREVRERSWNTDLLDLAFVEANTGWAVGTQDGKPLLLASAQGGDHDWSAVDLSSLALPDGKLTGLAPVGTDAVIVCGENGTVLRGTKSGGAWTWSKVAVPSSASFRGVAMQGTSGWMVGKGGVILGTADGGATWQLQTSNTTWTLSKVFALDATHAWATTGSSTLVRTSDGGTIWAVLTLPYTQSLQAVTFSTAQNGLAVGGRTVYATTDGGATWTSEFAGQDTPWRVNYLVCRLDGYQIPALHDGLPVDIKRMIDAAVTPSKGGRFILDQHSSGDDGGWAIQAAQSLTSLKQAGALGIDEIVLDATPTYLTGEKHVMGYSSWGSNDAGSHDDTQWAKPRNQWEKGSVSTTYVSTSARTMNYPPDYLHCQIGLCCPTGSAPGTISIGGCWEGWYGVFHDSGTGSEQQAASVDGLITFTLDHSCTDGYLVLYTPDGSEVSSLDASTDHPFVPTQNYGVGKQSLIADLLHEGCSASIGNVTEPYLEGCGQPQYLFPRYVEGFPWAECSYMAVAWGGWREVAVGDPLLAAYAKPLQVALTSPQSNSVLGHGRTYALSATVTSKDHRPIQRVEFWISDGKQLDALLGVATTAPYKITFTSGALPAPYSRTIAPGRYTIEAVAYADTNVREIGTARRTVTVRR